MTYKTFSFTEAGRKNFHVWLECHANKFDLAFEKARRGFELDALASFDEQNPGETLSYELRSTETKCCQPVTFSPNDDDVQETVHEDDE